jgi:hypothetical protein
VIDDQEKSMKTRFHRQLLIDNRLKKLNTATLRDVLDKLGNFEWISLIDLKDSY